ncbi:MAG: ABC transporter substrate-binding protein [Desulfatiglandaceae bacterium]
MFFSSIFRRMALLALPVLLTAATCAAAGPMETVKNITDRTIEILGDEELKAPDRAAQKRELLREAADQFFDWTSMAQTALSVHWRKRTEEEKEEFTRLFAEFLEKTYMDKVEGYSGEKIEYIEEWIDKDYPDEAVVKANVITEKQGKIPVEYLMMEKDGAWKVYDVLVEGVSLLRNYTSQFNSIILRSSYEELVVMLKEKIES